MFCYKVYYDQPQDRKGIRLSLPDAKLIFNLEYKIVAIKIIYNPILFFLDIQILKDFKHIWIYE